MFVEGLVYVGLCVQRKRVENINNFLHVMQQVIVLTPRGARVCNVRYTMVAARIDFHLTGAGRMTGVQGMHATLSDIHKFYCSRKSWKFQFE